MRRATLLALAVALTLALTGEAQAVTLAPGSITDPTTVHDLSVAKAYWGQAEPNCPQGISVTYFDGVALNDPGAAAYSTPRGCAIHLSRWRWVPLDARFSDGHTGQEELCMVIAHEWGHLVLGATFFAATNPTDPAHSPDPQSIMYSSPEYLPPGCKPAHTATHHRHRRATSRRR